MSIVCNTTGFIHCRLFFHLAVNDLSNFLLELGGFLRDYGCPYRNLLNNENRLNDRASRLLLLGLISFVGYPGNILGLDFLCTEIQAAKMNKNFKRDIVTNGADHSTNRNVELSGRSFCYSGFLFSHMKVMKLKI